GVRAERRMRNPQQALADRRGVPSPSAGASGDEGSDERLDERGEGGPRSEGDLAQLDAGVGVRALVPLERARVGERRAEAELEQRRRVGIVGPGAGEQL